MPAVFVHGITVRRDRFTDLLGAVRSGFQSQGFASVIDGFYWGDKASSLRYDGASIPEFLTGRRSFDARTDAMSSEDQLTMLLLGDPLLELRLLADAEHFEPSGAGFEPLPAGVDVRNQALQMAAPQIATALATDPELARAAGGALSQVDALALVQRCVDAAAGADRAIQIADLIDPLIRAVTASLYVALEGDRPTLDQRFRWHEAETRVEAIVESALAGQRSFIGDKLKSLAGGAASRSVTFAMRHGLRRRIMQSTSIFIGDVLAYMAKRDEVQASLEQTIVTSLAAHGGPLVLIGHSLGGIICFDYCLRTDRNIQRLLTVGSQVGLFAELGAFPTLIPGADRRLVTPQVVERWINIYDPSDILSFLAEPVLTGVTDVEFDTGAPFPVAHSEYWNLDELYGQLLK